MKESAKGLVFILVLTYLTVGYSIIILNKEALKSLIQAEATILGFFGIIVVYILKSLDDKQDRWDKTWFDLTEKGKDEEVDVGVAILMDSFSGVEAKSKGEICKGVISLIRMQRKR